MTVRLLVVLSVVEIVALVAVLAVYLVLLTRRLRSVSQNLARIAFGVRAVETQASKITPGLVQLNGAYERVGQRLGRLAAAAEATAGKR